MEIDFTDQIKKLKAQKECGCPDDCDCEGNCGGDCDCQQKRGYADHYPGKNVKRRKDGVPQKKQKKRACKKGEYRDKGGKLKKTKGETEVADYMPKTKGLENPRNQHEYDVDRDVDVDKPVDMSEYMPKTKGLQNPRNMHEYYKNLYRKVKGLD
ncbi:hypothetical protein CL634_03805 [bacterium]|nr:hypothetical protein [bacterium]